MRQIVLPDNALYRLQRLILGEVKIKSICIKLRLSIIIIQILFPFYIMIIMLVERRITMDKCYSLFFFFYVYLPLTVQNLIDFMITIKQKALIYKYY